MKRAIGHISYGSAIHTSFFFYHEINLRWRTGRILTFGEEVQGSMPAEGSLIFTILC